MTDASIIGVRVGLRWYVGLGMGGLYHFEVWSAMVNIETVTADNSSRAYPQELQYSVKKVEEGER